MRTGGVRSCSICCYETVPTMGVGRDGSVTGIVKSRWRGPLQVSLTGTSLICSPPPAGRSLEFSPLRGIWPGFEADLLKLGFSALTDLCGCGPVSVTKDYCRPMDLPIDAVIFVSFEAAAGSRKPARRCRGGGSRGQHLPRIARSLLYPCAGGERDPAETHRRLLTHPKLRDLV